MPKRDITTNDLAIMVKHGFDEMAGMMKTRFDAADKRFENIENRLLTLERGQEDIKLRLDNVAYRFELVELEKRVKMLEQMVLSKSKR